MRLKSLRKQQFGSNRLVTVPPALAGNLAKQAVQRLGVRVGDRMIEVVEDLPIPVFHRGEQWLKSRLQISRNAALPALIQVKREALCRSLPDIEKVFLEPVCGSECWEIANPGFQYEHLTLGQISATTQEDKPIMHQPLAEFRRQRGANTLANGFKRLVRHAYYMKAVNNDGRLWQHQAHSVSIGFPHINRNQGDFASIGQLSQSANNGLFRPIGQQIDNAFMLNIREHAIYLAHVDFIDAELRQRRGGDNQRRALCGLAENDPDGLLVQASFLRETDKGSRASFLLNVGYKSPSHLVIVMHLGQRFPEAPMAITAQVASAMNHDSGLFPMQGDIQKQLLFLCMTIQQHAATVDTTCRGCARLCGDLVAAGGLHNVQNMPARPIQNVHGGVLIGCKTGQRLPKLFFLAGLVSEMWGESNGCFLPKFRLA
ncbi:MAG TPA: hypothetical protein VFQ36_24260 [Ktedonobacteraceae bacterium]|nr:hypothetical protein [Ktedonobacteraceae bacterium]